MSSFKNLVRGLDEERLERLHRHVAEEMEQRRLKTAVRVEDIHPRMTPEDKARAIEEIARVLRERR